jgi:hypothetical protein
MDNPPRVRQRLGHVSDDAEGFVHRQPRVMRKVRTKRQAVDIGHHIVQPAIRDPGIEQRNDIGMH